jgi:hypothetical protein
MRSYLLLLAVCFPPVMVFACSASDGSQFGDTDNTNGGGGANAGGNAGGDSQTGGAFNPTSVGGGTTTPGCSDTDPNTDFDMDGFSESQGDCNDCDVNVNPNAIEVATPMMGMGGNGMAPPAADEDCDGMVDNLPQPCDSGLAIDSADPYDGARAIGLCKVSTDPGEWGVADAQWTYPAGNMPVPAANFDLGHGILAAFGPNVNVQEGSAMLGLSSGSARQPTDPGYMSVGGFSKGIFDTGHPVGFPKESPSCSGSITGTCNDGAALQLTLRPPSNATGFSFNFNFYTYEWPVYVCSTFNDFYAAILEPYPMGQTDGNITFDALANPISVNNAFFDVCGCTGGPPCLAGGISFNCALGDVELQGTGFEGHAATSWLQTTAPITKGVEFQLRFLAYDSGDGVLDSTGLTDNFEWLAEPGVSVGTEPVPNPK